LSMSDTPVRRRRLAIPGVILCAVGLILMASYSQGSITAPNRLSFWWEVFAGSGPVVTVLGADLLVILVSRFYDKNIRERSWLTGVTIAAFLAVSALMLFVLWVAVQISGTVAYCVSVAWSTCGP
jgi:ABC-type multidrug transport system permease subunit